MPRQGTGDEGPWLVRFTDTALSSHLRFPPAPPPTRRGLKKVCACGAVFNYPRGGDGGRGTGARIPLAPFAPKGVKKERLRRNLNFIAPEAQFNLKAARSAATLFP